MTTMAQASRAYTLRRAARFPPTRSSATSILGFPVNGSHRPSKRTYTRALRTTRRHTFITRRRRNSPIAMLTARSSSTLSPSTAQMSGLPPQVMMKGVTS